MRSLILTLWFIVFCMIINAQKVSLVKENYKYAYRSLPNFVLDKTSQTYSISVDKLVDQDLYCNESANLRINLEGRKKVNTSAAINLTIWMGNIAVESSVVDTRTTIKSDETGNEASRTSNFTVEVFYKFETIATVKDIIGNTITTYNFTNKTNKGSYSTTEHNNFSPGEEYNAEMSAIKTDLLKQKIDDVLSVINTNFNNDFGFQTVNLSLYLLNLDSKKHPENMAFRTAVMDAKAAIETITSNSIPADIEDKLAPSTKYFEELLTRLTIIDDKEQMKLRYAAYFNLAYIYYSTDNFDKAIEMCNLLISNDYEVKQGNLLIEMINSMKFGLQKHGTTTLHFNPEGKSY